MSRKVNKECEQIVLNQFSAGSASLRGENASQAQSDIRGNSSKDEIIFFDAAISGI